MAYLVRRLLLMIPTIAIVAFAAFGLMRLVPGDVILAQTAGQGGAQAAESLDSATYARIKKQLGLEGTIPQQFIRWVGNAARGNFGNSYLTNKPALTQFGQRLPVTAELGLIALCLSVITGIAVGVISALGQDKAVDYVARVAAILAFSIPNFFLAILTVLALSRFFGYSSPTGQHSLLSQPGTNLRQFLIPAVVLAAASSGAIARLTRTSMLEVLRQDYIRTAYAKGLRQRPVVTRHILKNALMPVLTLVGGQVVTVVAGAVVIEQIFNLRGVGQLTLTSLFQRDYVQLQTNVFLLAIVIVLANLLVDLTYGLLDPRIRYG